MMNKIREIAANFLAAQADTELFGSEQYDEAWAGVYAIKRGENDEHPIVKLVREAFEAGQAHGDFSNAPISLTEHRADKEADGSLWSERDCLISALRAIDNGVYEPNAAIVILRVKNGDGSLIKYYQKSANMDDLIGIIEHAKFFVMHDQYD